MNELIPKSTVPAGKCGTWCIEKFTVTEEEAKFQNIRAAFSFSFRGLYIKSGDYTRLIHNGQVIMSDVPSEIKDHIGFVHRATGNVLINGLGLGLCLAGVLQKPDVKFVTVIEIDPDVIALVGHHFQDIRVSIVNADALEFKPVKGEYFNTVWHDIWPNICADNLEEMKKLHRKYGRRCDWQGSWCRAQCERQR